MSTPLLLTRWILAILVLRLLFATDSAHGSTIQRGLIERLGLTARQSRLLFLSWLVAVGAFANLLIRITFDG